MCDFDILEDVHGFEIDLCANTLQWNFDAANSEWGILRGVAPVRTGFNLIIIYISFILLSNCDWHDVVTTWIVPFTKLSKHE